MSEPAVRGARILLVEDDEDLRLDMSEGLGEEGYLVTAVPSAEEALDQLRGSSFDLLITDYRLGGATGTWLARVAARSGHVARPHVLLVTAHRDVPDAEGIEVVHKPFDYDLFLGKVAQVLASPAAEASRSSTPHPSQRVAFTLYVNDAEASVRATRTLRALIGRHRPDQVALTVVDLTRQVDHRAEEDRVVVTPTLVKTFPGPRTWIIGDLVRGEIVERVLVEAGVEPLEA